MDDRLGVNGNSSFLFESNLPMLARRLSKVEVRDLKEIGSMLFAKFVLLLFDSDGVCWEGLLGFWLLSCSSLISSSSENAFEGTIFFWLRMDVFLRLRNFLVGDLLRALARKLSSFLRKFFSWNVAGCGADNLGLLFFSINASALRASLSTAPSFWIIFFK